jgi:hypothetical protein
MPSVLWMMTMRRSYLVSQVLEASESPSESVIPTYFINFPSVPCNCKNMSIQICYETIPKSSLSNLLLAFLFKLSWAFPLLLSLSLHFSSCLSSSNI